MNPPTKTTSVGCGRDIQRWLVRGMGYVCRNVPAEQRKDAIAMLQLVREALLVVLVLEDRERDDARQELEG